MSADLKKAIESLTTELQTILQKEASLKRTINELSVLVGDPPPYSNIDSSIITGIIRVQPDQFFGKALTTAMKEYLRMRGRAATAEEIYTALKEGGFEFTGDEKFWFRGVAVSLGKNRRDFVFVKSSSAYGLWEFYPEKAKEREKAQTEEPEEKEVDQKNENPK
jgi:hypothetical protein